MKLSTLFIVNAGFALFGAFGLLFAPEQMMSSYGATLTPTSTFLAQIISSLILGMAAISWLARNVKEKAALFAILVGFIIAHIGSALIALLAVSSGILNAMGWVDIGIHSLFALGFGYFLTKN